MVEREFTCLCGNIWRESRSKFYIDDEVTCPSCGLQYVLRDGESRAVELRQAKAARREARRQRRQQERERFANMACSVNQMQLNLQQLVDLQLAQVALLANLAPLLSDDRDLHRLAARVREIVVSIAPSASAREQVSNDD
ncbi:MAG: hypothetical protein AMXMBFR59_26190 [Rhodanobacteraceae bacterium]